MRDGKGPKRAAMKCAMTMVAIAVLLSGCGGGGSGPRAPAAPPDAPEPAREASMNGAPPGALEAAREAAMNAAEAAVMAADEAEAAVMALSLRPGHIPSRFRAPETTLPGR